MGVRAAVVEDVAKMIAEFTVLVVTGLHDAVLHSEGIKSIFARRITIDLDGPVVEVAPVEQVDPDFFIRIFTRGLGDGIGGTARGGKGDGGQDSQMV